MIVLPKWTSKLRHRHTHTDTHTHTNTHTQTHTLTHTHTHTHIFLMEFDGLQYLIQYKNFITNYDNSNVLIMPNMTKL